MKSVNSGTDSSTTQKSRDVGRNDSFSKRSSTWLAGLTFISAILPLLLTLSGFSSFVNPMFPHGPRDLLLALDVSATILAGIVVFSALVLYYTRRNKTVMVIGVSLLTASLIDLYHLSTLLGVELGVSSSEVDMTGLTWSLSRFYYATVLVFGTAALIVRRRRNEVLTIFLGVGLILIALLLLLYRIETNPGLPRFLEIGPFLGRWLRPIDLVTLLFYSAVGIPLLSRLHRLEGSFFSYTLFLSLVLHSASQIYFISSSVDPDHNHSVPAHLLRVVAYGLPLVGLLRDYVGSYRIQDRLLAEVRQQLREKADLQRERDSFFELSLEMLAVAEASGRFRQVNPAWEAVLGYTQEEMLKTDFYSLVHPDDLTGFVAELEQIITGEGQYRTAYFETRLRHKDGSYRWLAWNCGTDEHNELLLGAARDVSEQKMMNDALNRSRTILSGVLESSNDAIGAFESVRGHDGTLGDLIWSSANRRLGEMIEIPAEQLVGHSFSETVIPGWLSDQRGRFVQVIETGQSIEETIFIDDAEGDTWLDVSIVPLGTGGCAVTFRDVTEQKRVEADLQEQGRLLLEAQGLASMGHWRFDARKERLTISEQLKSILDLTQNAPADYAEILERIHPDDRAAVIEAWENDLTNTLSGDFSFRIVRTNGAVRHIFLRSISNFDEEGLLSEVHGYMQDVTEQVLTEERLQTQQDRLSEAQRLAQIGSWEYDIKENRSKWSDALYQLFGFEEQTPITIERILSAVHEDDRERMRRYYAQNYGEGETVAYSMRIVRADGSLRFLQSRGKVIVGSDGLPEKIVGTTQDVTEEQEVRRSLEAQRERLNEAQRIAKVGYWEWRLESDSITMTEGLYRIHGVSPDTPITKAMDLRRYTHPDDHGILRRLAADLGPTDDSYSFQYRIFRSDGELRILRGNALVHRDQSGDIQMIRGTCQDVTEQVEAERRLARQTDDLARSNRDLEQFAYIASHDLQEPLRKIRSFTELLSRRYAGEIDETADTWLAYITDGAERMQKLIKDILAYSRIGRGNDEERPLSLERPLELALLNLSSKIEAEGAAVTWDELPVLPINVSRTTQLFQNFVDNALKFRGEAAPQVHIGYLESDDEHILSVQDNGIGIEKAYVGKIFDMFRRLHARNEYPGSGIGLSICQRIVEQQGGQIWVESEPGKGTTFYFTFPRSSTILARNLKASQTRTSSLENSSSQSQPGQKASLSEPVGVQKMSRTDSAK